MDDDRVQIHVLEAFNPQPASPFDDQALGYQLLHQTIQSVFPELHIIVPGNDFISAAGGRKAQNCFLSASTALPPPQLFILETAVSFPLLVGVELYFPLGVEVRKQTGKEDKQLDQWKLDPCLT